MTISEKLSGPSQLEELRGLDSRVSTDPLLTYRRVKSESRIYRHETVAIALTWAIYLLAKHPDVQTQLRNELDCHIPNIGATNDFHILESLPILNGVVNETLRLYPSAPVAVRVPIRDTCILGHHVPKGTRLFIAPWAVNRATDLWGPRAEKFLPGRWIDPITNTPDLTGGTTTKSPLLTFLHGPRNCIGQGFAKAELLTLVTAFARGFEISMVNPGEVKLPGGSLSAKPAGGMKLKLKIIDEALLQEAIV